jgi:hypothetical protein
MEKFHITQSGRIVDVVRKLLEEYQGHQLLSVY